MSVLSLLAGVLSINLAFSQAAEKPDSILLVSDDIGGANFDVATPQQTDPITLVISEVVEHNRIQEYEN